MTISGRTAREQRETRRADASRSLARILVAHDLAHAEVARICGVSETIVHEWCDPTKPRALSLADAMALPVATRRVLAELLAGPGAVVRIVPAGDPSASLGAARGIQRSGADVVDAHLDALDDGLLTRSEATPLRARIQDHRERLEALDQVAARAEREGVIPISRRRG
jgi:hypothetical protein